MSPEREEIITRLWSRMASVTGVKSTARNPSNPPKESELPRINIFEGDDVVVKESSRGASQKPHYNRDWTVVLETFIRATSEKAGSKELSAFMSLVKSRLYDGGITLGLRNVSVQEKSSTGLLRAPDLDLVMGIGLVLSVRYVEDCATLT